MSQTQPRHTPVHAWLNLTRTPALPPAPAEKYVVRKRLPAQPRDAFALLNVKPETITAIPYDIIKESLV